GPAGAKPPPGAAEPGRGARRGRRGGRCRGGPAGEAGGHPMSVLVLVETDAGGATEISREALTFARRIGGDLQALVVGDGPPGLVDQLGAYGVTVVHHADGDAFTSYAAAAWAAAVVAAAARAAFGTAAGTSRGKEVLAHAACRLGVPMAATVVEVDSVAPLVVSRQ